jgi:hypothetical protein
MTHCHSKEISEAFEIQYQPPFPIFCEALHVKGMFAQYRELPNWAMYESYQ